MQDDNVSVFLHYSVLRIVTMDDDHLMLLEAASSNGIVPKALNVGKIIKPRM